MISINVYMTIRGVIIDAALLYGIIYFYKKNKYTDGYAMELFMCVFVFICITFLLGFIFVDFN